jgi:quercetin dioxygenase-like cupin family protein
MKKVTAVDVSKFSFLIDSSLSVTPVEQKEGPPDRLDGMTVGIVTMEHDAPHGGEVHPDGDEILYVISGAVSITSDSNPGEDLALGPGDACIVAKGEWHRVHILEKTQLLHLTPGPGGDHRPQK